MLSAESAAVIRATLPPVGAALDEITTRFYATMLAGGPVPARRRRLGVRRG